MSTPDAEGSPATTDPGLQPSLYEDALVYDILHGPGTADELAALEAIAERVVGRAAVARGACWMEPACGTARLLRLFMRRKAGRRVIGFDRSEALLAYARERLGRLGLSARGRFFAADMESFADGLVAEFSRPIVAINTINTIRHLSTDAAVRAHLAEVARTLARGGVYLVGVSTCPYDWDQPAEDVWRGSRGKTSITQIAQYEPPELVTDGDHAGIYVERVVSHLVITRDVRGQHAERHETSGYALRVYTLADWHAVIESSTMQIAGVFDAEGEPDEPAEYGYRIYALTARA